MEKIRYLYVDDELAEATCGFENELLGIFVDVLPPTLNGMDILNEIEKYDGLILDLRLDEVILPSLMLDNDKPDKSKRSNIRGTSIAQEIRTRATEGNMNDLPIILFSADSKLKESFYPDSTSHDLFDFKLLKRNASKDGFFEDAQKLLITYAKVYKLLREKKGNKPFSAFGLKETTNCHKGFLGNIESLSYQIPTHELVRLVKKEIEMTGVLVDEILLATRLGIDIQRSEDWLQLKNVINTTVYSGILSDYYPRWWMHLVKNFWSHNISESQRLENLTAFQRVELIKLKLGLHNLVPIQKQKGNRGSNFWIACKATNEALTMEDGILLLDKDHVIWREPAYISATTYFNSTKKGIIWQKVDPSEWDRIEKLKKLYTHGRQRREN